MFMALVTCGLTAKYTGISSGTPIRSFSFNLFTDNQRSRCLIHSLSRRDPSSAIIGLLACCHPHRNDKAVRAMMSNNPTVYTMIRMTPVKKRVPPTDASDPGSAASYREHLLDRQMASASSGSSTLMLKSPPMTNWASGMRRQTRTGGVLGAVPSAAV